jgi:hypothetical protein
MLCFDPNILLILWYRSVLHIKSKFPVVDSMEEAVVDSFSSCRRNISISIHITASHPTLLLDAERRRETMEATKRTQEFTFWSKVIWSCR